MKRFTLIELLVVVAIIGILMSILLPSLLKAREMGKRAVCASNLHQQHLSFTVFANDNNGNYPGHLDPGRWPIGWFKANEGHRALYENGLLDGKVFFCPSSKKTNWISYEASWPAANGDRYAGYAFWANYWRASSIDDKIASNSSSDSDTMLLSDKIFINSGDPSFSNHTSTGGLDGGNITFNDGHTKWRHYKSMTFRFTLLYDFWY